MSKQQLIAQYVDQHIGETITTTQLAEAVGCTLPTVLSFIKNNEQRFVKTGRGRYAIREAATVQQDEVVESNTELPASVTVTAFDTSSTVMLSDFETVSSTGLKLPDPDAFDW